MERQREQAVVVLQEQLADGIFSMWIRCQAAETAKVSFTNEYNSSGNHGGAVTNRFDYSSESGWGWTQE